MAEQNNIAEMTFEEAMKAFEQVVNQLDRGDVPLDQLIALGERGAVLKKRCSDLLKEAEERVEKITLGMDGQPTGTTPVEGL
ncbi:exodeoxyribonuclease VII small subunit [Thioclava sp. SK-1]|uniref:exodeoxyribonuclease VII small subunit n=1 Tax=Thioclava sp. SK-1 TaxID=1889770 RepID=UPI000826B1D8|nr:exodeoxyribonuclease VII small subunit [Thioclava sp. SK-1]OCX65808.1 exodeoxyribonuclease VII small subunit [Thioclava sp. SK-1]